MALNCKLNKPTEPVSEANVQGSVTPNEQDFLNHHNHHRASERSERPRLGNTPLQWCEQLLGFGDGVIAHEDTTNTNETIFGTISLGTSVFHNLPLTTD